MPALGGDSIDEDEDSNGDAEGGDAADKDKEGSFGLNGEMESNGEELLEDGGRRFDALNRDPGPLLDPVLPPASGLRAPDAARGSCNIDPAGSGGGGVDVDVDDDADMGVAPWSAPVGGIPNLPPAPPAPPPGTTSLPLCWARGPVPLVLMRPRCNGLGAPIGPLDALPPGVLPAPVL